MTQAVTVKGSKLLIKVGNGADPEVFSHNCSINAQRGMALSAETNDSNVPDCDDPDAIPWLEREKRSKSGTITGQGTLNASDQDLFFAWLVSDDTKNVKVVTDISGATGGRVYAGAFHCTQFEITGAIGEKVQANITLVSSGEITQANNT